MTEQQHRAKFEFWMREYNSRRSLDRFDRFNLKAGKYRSMHVELAWQSWLTAGGFYEI